MSPGTLGMSPGEEAVAVGPVGGGAVIPTDGISPAITAVERTHESAIAFTSCFIDFLLMRVLRMQDFLHQQEIEQLPEVLASVARRLLLSPP
jgi:hypothetical protein